MARRKMTQLPLDLPDDYDRKKIRPWLTAPNCEEVKRKYFTPASRRTIRETWPLEWRYADGYAVTARDPFLDECERRLAEAPVIMGGKRPAPEYDAASPLSIERSRARCPAAPRSSGCTRTATCQLVGRRPQGTGSDGLSCAVARTIYPSIPPPGKPA